MDACRSNVEFDGNCAKCAPRSGLEQALGNDSESCPISACPMCDYPLIGLPTPHRCPECGFEYNHETMVVRNKDNCQPARFLTKACVSIVLLWCVRMLISPYPVNIELQIAVMCIFAGLALREWLVARNKPFIALGRVGVIVRLGSLPARTISYEEVREVRLERMSGRLFVFLLLRGEGTIDCTAVFSNEFEIRAFQNGILAQQTRSESDASQQVQRRGLVNFS